jgi:hypothetical protein
VFESSLKQEFDLAGSVFGFTAEELAGIEDQARRFRFRK